MADIERESRLEGISSLTVDFRLMGKLGEGTFSVVLKVKHKKSSLTYAMKRFRKTFSSIEEVESLREIQALKRLNPHPHIIDLIETIFEPKHGILSLNFELMDCNLYEMISKKAPNVSEEKAKSFFWQICKALEYIHGKGIFHRDIKPENILVKDGTVKIADFGSCRGIHSKMPFTEYIATRWYRPPECLLCDGMYNYKMDIWSAGCVLFEIVARAPLFPGADELDQLHKIHSVMGTPSPKLLRHLIGSTKANSLKYNFPQKDGCGIRSLISTSSDSCIDLINLLLRYDPDDRYTSKEALRHSFFDGVQLPESIKQQVATIKHQKQNIENVLKIKSDAQTLSNNNATLSNTNISKYDTSNSNLTKTETQIMKAVSYKNISEESKYIPVDSRQYPVEKEQMKKVIKAYAPGPQELKLPRLTFQTNQYDNMGNIKTNTRQDLLPIGHQRRLRRHEEKKIQSSYNSSSTNWNSGFGVVGKAPVGSTKFPALNQSVNQTNYFQPKVLVKKMENGLLPSILGEKKKAI